MMGWTRYGTGWEFPHSEFWGIIGIIAVVELILKGFALWRSAKNNQSYWFIAILILNTAGILPAVYLLIFSKNAREK